MTRRMYDAVTPGDIPPGAQLVAGYADGAYANIWQMRTQFPHAEVVVIAVDHRTRAQVADVERGDMTPETAVEWARDTMHDVSNTDLTLYASTDTWPAIKAAFAAASVSLPQWWAAHWTGVPHLEPDSIATQYLDTGGYDESLVADYWPGVDPAPPAPPPVAPPPVIVPPVTVPLEDEMFIVTVDRTDYPDQAEWPGTFLLTSAGELRHIVDQVDLAWIERLGLKSAEISRRQYESLLAGK